MNSLNKKNLINLESNKRIKKDVWFWLKLLLELKRFKIKLENNVIVLELILLMNRFLEIKKMLKLKEIIIILKRWQEKTKENLFMIQPLNNILKMKIIAK